MDIALIIGGDGEVVEFQDAEVTRGLEGFAGLYPNSQTLIVPINKINVGEGFGVYFFQPGAQDIDKMSEVAIELKKNFPDSIIAVRDSDPATHWLTCYPFVTKETLTLFDSCDLVATHHENMVGVISTLTSTPVFYLGEPSRLATSKNDYPSDQTSRDVILLPTGHCNAYNCKRNAMLNYVVVKKLIEAGVDSRIELIANQVFVNEGDTSINEFELLHHLDLGGRVRLVRPRDRLHLFDLLMEAKLFINLDATNCIGHWHIDAAALRAPTVSSNMPCASRLFKETFCEYDIEGIVEYAKGLLENPVEDVDYAFEQVDHFNYDNVRARLENIIQGD